jgi:hypothetical protein
MTKDEADHLLRSPEMEYFAWAWSKTAAPSSSTMHPVLLQENLLPYEPGPLGSWLECLHVHEPAVCDV